MGSAMVLSGPIAFPRSMSATSKAPVLRAAGRGVVAGGDVGRVAMVAAGVGGVGGGATGVSSPPHATADTTSASVTTIERRKCVRGSSDARFGIGRAPYPSRRLATNRGRRRHGSLAHLH